MLQFVSELLEERVVVLANRTKCAVSSLVPLLQYPPAKLKRIFSCKNEDGDELVDQNSKDKDRIVYLSKKLNVRKTLA
jgi:hypothetical protein